MVIKDGWKDTGNTSANAQDNPSICDSWGYRNTCTAPIAKIPLCSSTAIAKPIRASNPVQRNMAGD